MPPKKKKSSLKTQDILKGYALKRVREAHRHIKKRHNLKAKGEVMQAYDSFDEAINALAGEQQLCPDVLLAILFANFRKALNILSQSPEFSHESIAVNSEKFVEAMKALLNKPTEGA